MDAAQLAWTAGKTVVLYAIVIALLRWTGNRTLAKLRAFDFLVTIAMGSVVATALTQPNAPFWGAVLVLALLVALQWIVARLGHAIPAAHGAVTSRAILLVHQGEVLEDALRRARITRDEVDAAARRAGLGRWEDVGSIVLEANGELSVLRRGAGEETLGSVRGLG